MAPARDRSKRSEPVRTRASTAPTLAYCALLFSVCEKLSSVARYVDIVYFARPWQLACSVVHWQALVQTTNERFEASAVADAAVQGLDAHGRINVEVGSRADQPRVAHSAATSRRHALFESLQCQAKLDVRT